ncbi:hypothetical protein B1756_16895 [Natrarchaeobaculum aegyptiacum]|uniref:Uncharacterized protein n=1 Tax=Natrarchaeobaculum aegyptiacum TaxID=745377 RepID=A0A2Z2HVC8_9EURY|nr:hypothetical protein B1756_16895 [Natrarchaeobaculum aegyptiacum]
MGASIASVSSAIAGCLGDASPAADVANVVGGDDAGSETDERGTEDDTGPDVADWVEFEHVDEASIERVEAIDLEAELDDDADEAIDEFIDDRDHDGVHDCWLVNEADEALEATMDIVTGDETVLEGSVSLPAGGALEMILSEEGAYETTVAAESDGTTTETTTTATPDPSCTVSRTVLAFGDGGSVSTHTESRC